MDIYVLIGLFIGMYYLMKGTKLQLNIAGDSGTPAEKPLPDLREVSAKIPKVDLPIPKYDLTMIYKKYGQQYQIDWMLIRAITLQESSENPNAVNPADPSYGLMQILYKLDSEGNPNKFNVNGWPPHYTSQLFDPDYNVWIGSQILAWNLKTYGYPKGIAVYNSWIARKNPPNGPFDNQAYVDSVLIYYDAIKQQNGVYNGISA